MSLIYTALNSLEKKQAEGMTVEPQISTHPPRPIQRDSARWLYAAGIGSIVAVAIGGTALAILREHSKEVAPPLVAIAPSVAVTAPQMAMPEPVQQAPVVPVPVQQAGTPTPVAFSAKPAEQAVERAPTEPLAVEKTAAPAVAPQPAVAKSARRAHPAQAVENESAQPKPADEDLNRLAMAAKQAIDAGNKDEAETMLLQLAAHLPPESLTLLRLRAWQALRDDDRLRATALYGQIVERLPDDESASINLAVLNWKAGRHDEARRIVATLAERRPDSETVRRYVAQFGERR